MGKNTHNALVAVATLAFIVLASLVLSKLPGPGEDAGAASAGPHAGTSQALEGHTP